MLTSSFTFCLISKQLCLVRNHAIYKLIPVLVKMNNQCIFKLFACNIEGDVSFQKLQNILMAKALKNPCILCKVLSVQTQITKNTNLCSESYSPHVLSKYRT